MSVFTCNYNEYFSTVTATTKIKKDGIDIEEADDRFQGVKDGSEFLSVTLQRRYT